ncbi:MAG: TonB-dependent receptor [Chitinophagaceae bacterium]
MQKGSIRNVFIFILGFATIATARAQDDSASASLTEVVVTAQRMGNSPVWVPYAIKKLDSQYLHQYGPRTTAEALQAVTGVFVQKTNHGGGSAFIRGLTGNQTLILIDGIRLNNATFRYGPNQYLNTIDPYLINSIEVAKGTGSVQYGSDALGGVIQVLTSDPRFAAGNRNWSGSVLLRGMTGSMEKTARGTVSYSSQRAAFTGGLTYRSFGDLIGGDTTGRQTPSGYNEWAFNTKGKLALRNDVTLTLSQQYLEQTNVPVYHKIVLENFEINEFVKQQRSLQYAKLAITGRHHLVNKIELIASYQQSGEERASLKRGSQLYRNEKDEVHTTGVSAEIHSGTGPEWKANSGVEVYHDKVRSFRRDINRQNSTAKNSRGLYPDRAGYNNYSVYSLHHFKRQNWVADAGLRFNTFSISLTDSALGKITLHPAALVWNASLMYVFVQHHFYGTYSTGYRAPNIDDLGSLGVVDFRFEVPSGNLAPEKSGNAEVGYKFKNDKLRGDLALYQMTLRDLITRTKGNEIRSGYPVYSKSNIEHARIQGVEAELGWKVIPTVELTANGTYTYGQNTSKGEPLRRIPPLHGRFTGAVRKDGWFAIVELLLAGKQDRLASGDKEDNRIPFGGTPGWRVFNSYAGYEWSCVKLNAGLQNVFNQDYRTHGSGINGVGRSAWLSAAVKF